MDVKYVHLPQVSVDPLLELPVTESQPLDFALESYPLGIVDLAISQVRFEI